MTPSECAQRIQDLEAEVAEYQALFTLALRRERPWIARWQQATGQPDTLPDYGELLAWLADQAEQARYRLDLALATLKEWTPVVLSAKAWDLAGDLKIAHVICCEACFNEQPCPRRRPFLRGLLNASVGLRAALRRLRATEQG